MEPDSSYYEKMFQERNNGIKVIADQMARKYFGYDDDSDFVKISKEQLYELILGSKINETESSKNNIPNSNENKPSQIVENNSNINTNINTKENNLVTNINSNINTGANINTFTNYNALNENEFISNLNSKRKEKSLKNESLADNKNSTERDMNVFMENISTNKMNDLSDDSFENINIITNHYKKETKRKIKKKTIYDRCLLEKERIENKLNKKRKEKELKDLKEVKSFPDIDPYSEEIIQSKDYIPIDERAAQIHSMKIFKNIINEEKNKIKDYINQMNETSVTAKKFDQKNWDKFIKRQKKWNKKVQYKIKAAIILRDNEEEEKFYKPRINSKSKLMIEEIEDENKSWIDDIYSRLYNDFDEHNERQKFRNQQSLPSFRPKISKCSSQKIFGFNSKRTTNRCGTNPTYYLNNKNKSIKSYNLNNSIERKRKQLVIDSCNNFGKYSKNINRNDKNNDKYLKYINKSRQTNQQTKNNISNLNCSQASSGLINSKYIILDNQKLNKKGKSKKNSTAPFLPLNIKKMIEKNCKEEEENMPQENGNKIPNQNINKEKYHFNLSLYNMEESKEKDNNEKKEKHNEGELKSISVGIERNENKNESQLDELNNNNNNNNSELISQKEKKNEEILEKLEQSKVKDLKSIDSEKSNNYDKGYYKINIRDSTPNLIKENTVLASKDYSDFFDIPDLDDEN